MMRTGILDDELLHEHNFKIEKKKSLLNEIFPSAFASTIWLFWREKNSVKISKIRILHICRKVRQITRFYELLSYNINKLSRSFKIFFFAFKRFFSIFQMFQENRTHYFNVSFMNLWKISF